MWERERKSERVKAWFFMAATEHSFSCIFYPRRMLLPLPQMRSGIYSIFLLSLCSLALAHPLTHWHAHPRTRHTHSHCGTKDGDRSERNWSSKRKKLRRLTRSKNERKEARERIVKSTDDRQINAAKGSCEARPRRPALGHAHAPWPHASHSLGFAPTTPKSFVAPLQLGSRDQQRTLLRQSSACECVRACLRESVRKRKRERE